MTIQVVLEALKQLSVAELNEVQKQISIEVAQRQTAGRTRLRQEFAQMAANSGLTLEEVLGGGTSKKVRSESVAKYANPTNAAETWTGRGRKPSWLIAYVANGGTLESLAI